jgi:hypothetical protein
MEEFSPSTLTSTWKLVLESNLLSEFLLFMKKCTQGLSISYWKKPRYYILLVTKSSSPIIGKQP